MKKLLLTSILMFAIIAVFAQSPWWVGGHLGVNFNTVTGQCDNDDDTKHNFITTPMFGAVAMYSVNDMISVGAELNIAKSGAIYKYDDYSYETRNLTEADKIKYKECYTVLQIPLLAKFTFGEEWQYFGYGGFYWSYILGGKYKVDSEYGNYDGKIKFGDYPDNYNGDDMYLDKDYNRRADLGLNVGGGVQKELGPGIIAADLRFGIGFLDSYKWPDNDKPDGYKAYRNFVIGLNISYLINLGN